jgi:hypothetical protein
MDAGILSLAAKLLSVRIQWPEREPDSSFPYIIYVFFGEQ